jgi:hypothetical protein
MTAVAFDTLAYARRLKEAGFTEPQAEAQAEALAEALASGMAELATKADLEALATATKADLKALELRLDARLEALQADLLKWVIGLFIAQVGLFAALVKLLH